MDDHNNPSSPNSTPSVDSGTGIMGDFVERNKKRERTKTGTKRTNSLSQFWIPVSVFCLAPLLTILFLLILEWFFVVKFPDYGLFSCFVSFFVALYRVLQRSDMIFLSFSLALTVILESITTKGKSTSLLIMVIEFILGLSALALYIVEETCTRMINVQSANIPLYLSDNALMDARALLHSIFLFFVIFFAVLGYYMRAKKIGIRDVIREFRSNPISGNTNQEGGACKQWLI